MTLPFLEQNGVKFALFSNPDLEPYGAFTNDNALGKYPIRQKVIIFGKRENYTWPTSEHAFHAQKIISLKNKLSANSSAQKILLEMLADIERMKIRTDLVEGYYNHLVTEKYISQLSQALKIDSSDKTDFQNEFNKLCKAYSDEDLEHHMTSVVRLKLRQYPKLAKIAMQLGKEGVLPVFVSNNGFWGAGIDGQGKNMLGIIVLQESNHLLSSDPKRGTPSLMNPEACYHFLRDGFNLAKPAVLHLLDPQNWGSEITRFKYSKDSYNHYFYDKELEINVTVDKKSQKLIYQKNDKSITVNLNYHNFVGSEVYKFLTAKNEKNFSFEPHQLKYEGSYNNVYKYHDPGLKINILESDNGVLFSQYGVEIVVSEFYEITLLNKVSQIKQEITNYYEHSKFENKSRLHFFKASVEKNDNISKKHHNLMGDALKTSLLMTYKCQLEHCTSALELELAYDDIVTSSPYINVLAKGQGVATRLFHRKTSSVEALYKIKEDLLTKFNNPQSSFTPYSSFA